MKRLLWGAAVLAGALVVSGAVRAEENFDPVQAAYDIQAKATEVVSDAHRQAQPRNDYRNHEGAGAYPVQPEVPVYPGMVDPAPYPSGDGLTDPAQPYTGDGPVR